MATITKISVQQKNKERYSIFINRGHGEEYGFSVDENTLIKHMLKVGMDIDEGKMIEIRIDEEKRQAYLQAINYLSHAMRATKDVADHLAKKDHHEIVIAEVIEKLQSSNYLNDLEYAKAYVRTYSNTSKKGPISLRRELKQKGITEKDVEIALAAYSEEKQIANAIKLCDKKQNTYRKFSQQETKEKLTAMLSRKGYPFSIISIALEEVHLGSEEEEKEIIQTHFEKLHRKHQDLESFDYERKVKQALYRKGFSMDDIEEVLRKNEE